MNLQKLIGLSRTELAATLLIFLFLVLTVIGSRSFRLTSESAIIFDTETEFIFTESASLDNLLAKLQSKEAEFDESEFLWAAKILGWRNFQRGRYVFEGNSSYDNFLSKMARGIQDPVSVVILPGSTPEKLSQIVSNHLHFSAEEFEETLTDSSFLAEKGLSETELFGRILPETYHIYWTSSPTDVVNRILRAFEASFSEEFRNRAQELKLTINEVITLASIIEWEAKFEEEKTRISGLYWNRLNRRMRLQADPTVNFAVGERRRLLFEDYQIDHPYNTYIYRGLPPGPITNPSFTSIRAALYPEDHDYLYMVANPEGGHTFTKTFREHQAESEKWRIWLREQYRIKRQREAEEKQQQENS